MGRNIEEIWDGRFYDSSDLVRADCGGCHGCSECCHGMGDTVVTDPYDLHRLAAGLNLSPADLLAQGKIALHVTQGAILPHLAMSGEKEACVFLDSDGRCSVHAFRPGFCRLFPLGRYYEENGFRYFLQKDECPKKNRTKVRVSKWLDIPDLPRYENWINAWHQFLLAKQVELSSCGDEQVMKAKNLQMLQVMFLTPIPADKDILTELAERMDALR